MYESESARLRIFELAELINDEAAIQVSMLFSQEASRTSYIHAQPPLPPTPFMRDRPYASRPPKAPERVAEVKNSEILNVCSSFRYQAVK